MTLRARLVALGAGAAVTVLVLLAVPVTLVVVAGAHDDAERDAATLVQGVADYLSTGNATVSDLEAILDRGRGRRGDSAVVVLADGTAIGTGSGGCEASDDSPDPVRREDTRGDTRGDRDGLDDLLVLSGVTTQDVRGGTRVSLQARDSQGTVSVCAFVDDSDVNRQVVERLAPLAGAGAGVLIVVTGVSLLLARRLSRHLERAAATADLLGSGDLDARVAPAGPPEVRRLGTALNRLAGRIDELLTLERETVADLSHRLRTPLTAIRLDVEALPDSSAKAELDVHVAQLERTLTAVIQAARRPQRDGVRAACDVDEVVRERYAFWSALLEDQGRETSLVVSLPPQARIVRCARTDLVAALDALLENAVAHTQEGVPVSVDLGPVEPSASPVGGHDDAPLVRLEVRDRGPGVPSIALERGRSDRGSSGLGLDIARGCAEASGGRLELDVQDGWSVVRLVLGTWAVPTT